LNAIGQSSAQFALRDPDVRLMLRVRADEAGAFEELVQTFQGRLVSIMFHMVGNREEAEDLAQEVFLRVFKSRKSYHPKAKFSTWLFTIANNLALNSIRNRKKKPSVPFVASESGTFHQIPTDLRLPPREDHPSSQIQNQELAQVIQKALEGLNERQRMAVVLNKYEDMNYADIASVMELTPKAVKSLLSRARLNLKEALKAYIYMDQGFGGIRSEEA
jgi:RNA polymerase sigma-70 factor, ECF subfamily